MAEHDVVDLNRQRLVAERERRVAELLGGDLGGEPGHAIEPLLLAAGHRGHLALAVAAHPPDGRRERGQAIQARPRERAGNGVASDDDEVGPGRPRIAEHGIERVDVAVDVVERQDLHRRKLHRGLHRFRGDVAPVYARLDRMPRTRRHPEIHRNQRSNWLRAAVLGANDGILSTASLVLGVAAAGASTSAIVTAGVAGLAAGALSMAAGEYVSVSSQRDAEDADIRLEERELRRDPHGELHELAGIYEGRGLPAALAAQVAEALSERDALEAHARDELGLSDERRARPFQAAWASALSFSAGAALPLVVVAVTPAGARVTATIAVTLVALALLGDLGASLGGAPRRRATLR